MKLIIFNTHYSLNIAIKTVNLQISVIPCSGVDTFAVGDDV